MFKSRDQTQVSCIAGRFFTQPQGKPKNTGVGSLSLLQQTFLTQELNWGLLNCRQILSQVSYQGSPKGRVASLWNQTPISHMTDQDTHHYTNEEKNYNLKALKSASLTWLSFLGSIFVSPDTSVLFHLDVKESQNFSILKLNSVFSPTSPLSQICFLSKKINK